MQTSGNPLDESSQQHGRTGEWALAWGRSPHRPAQALGRDEELARIRTLLDAASEGLAGCIVIEGEPGIGKTTLLDAAAEMATGFRCLSTTGIEAEAVLGHAALLELLGPLQDRLADVPGAQADALASAMGWGPANAVAERFLVAAGTLSLLAATAERTPVLVLVDDLHWVDRASTEALLFAARRLRFDAVAFLFAVRSGSATPELLAGLPVLALGGLPSAVAAELLPGSIAAGVVDRLVNGTQGNPLALVEVGRELTAAQRVGASPLPDPLPVGDRLQRAYESLLGGLPAESQRAVLLCALNMQASTAALVAAIGQSGGDAAAALDDAEQRGILIRDGPGLRFRHPLLRTAAVRRATPAERRSAHRALAAALSGDAARSVRAWHLAEAALGPDNELADDLVEIAEQSRIRNGYAQSSVVIERAALLTSHPELASERLAVALGDAFMAGDVKRTRALAARVLDSPASPRTRAQALFNLGMLEQYAGSVPRAAELLAAAADMSDGKLRVWALAELCTVQFRLNDLVGIGATASRLAAVAADTDPEQRLLSCFTSGVALSLGGDPETGGVLLAEVERLVTSPPLNDDPRMLTYLAITASFLGHVRWAVTQGQPRVDQARSRGAVGILVPVLSLIAAGRAWIGDHAGAFADAGEAAELGEQLGYAADTAVAVEMLAWQSAARGRHEEAKLALARARALTDRAGTTSVHAHHAITAAFCALSRGAPAEAAALLEERIVADGGVGSLGEPLGVAPLLVEAYVALDRKEDAAALAARYAAETPKPTTSQTQALVARCRALAAEDEETATKAFEAALAAHTDDTDVFEAARTRMLYGEMLRRAGLRIAARIQLRAALDAFTAMDLTAWARRATGELAATGATARSRRLLTSEPLTSQETRVAILVARGLSNREVAAALFLSPKTIEHHLGSVFRKRGFRSRTELARALANRPEQS